MEVATLSVVIDSMSISIEKTWIKKRKYKKENAEAKIQFGGGGGGGYSLHCPLVEKE